MKIKVANELAKESIKDGLDNFGFVYSQMRNGMVKISIRSEKNYSGGDCETVAREYNGGGHFNASGFFLSKEEFKKWI